MTSIYAYVYVYMYIYIYIRTHTLTHHPTETLVECSGLLFIILRPGPLCCPEIYRDVPGMLMLMMMMMIEDLQ